MDKKEELELGQRYYKAKEAMEKWKKDLEGMKSSTFLTLTIMALLIYNASYIIASIIAGATALAWVFTFVNKRKILEEYKHIKNLMKDKNITDFIEKKDYEVVYEKEQNNEFSMENIPNMQNSQEIKVDKGEKPVVTNTTKSTMNKKR